MPQTIPFKLVLFFLIEFLKGISSCPGTRKFRKLPDGLEYIGIDARVIGDLSSMSIDFYPGKWNCCVCQKM